MTAPNEITPTQLLRLIGTPDCPIIVDICIEEDFAKDPFLIPGALRHPHSDIPGLLARLKGRDCVIVCQKGLKLSQGLVAWLRTEGMRAEYLQGGMFAWRDDPSTQRVPASALPQTHLWVTRHRPKIDRIACPWLIRRFVDRDARFLFVAPGQVDSVADRYGGIAFDVDGAFFADTGTHCTFDALLDAFALHSDALDRMATVIRAADTERHETSPQAAGLLALSVGLSRQYRDDTSQLEAGLPIYDALFRWARDGFDERHCA
jgi:rhodanese-related sulfurtransferase